MKRILVTLPVCAALALPVHAEEAETEPPSMMERGFQMFLEGFVLEMKPAIEDLQGFADEMEPAFRAFTERMGPLMADLFDKIDDINRYEVPEVLPNGDIIIRRKPEDAPDAEPEEGGDIEI